MGGAPSLILPNLWLGGQDVVNNSEFFVKNGIGFVLSIGPAAPPPYIRLAGREHIVVPDTPTADLGRHFRRAVTFIAEARHQAGSGVYVHCAAGISRSTTCVCAYLMTHLGLPFREVLAFVASKRRTVCPNDGFMQQLRRFEASRERTTLGQEILHRDMEEVSRSMHAGAAPSTRSASVGAARQAGHLSAVEQQQQENALRAVRDAIHEKGSGQRQENALRAVRDAIHEKGSGQRQANQLRLGRGDVEGDVGLGWLVKPSGQGGQPAAGRPSLKGAGAAEGRAGSKPTASRRSAHSAAPVPIFQSLGAMPQGRGSRADAASAGAGRVQREGGVARRETPPLPQRVRW